GELALQSSLERTTRRIGAGYASFTRNPRPDQSLAARKGRGVERVADRIYDAPGANRPGIARGEQPADAGIADRRAARDAGGDVRDLREQQDSDDTDDEDRREHRHGHTPGARVGRRGEHLLRDRHVEGEEGV